MCLRNFSTASAGCAKYTFNAPTADSETRGWMWMNDVEHSERERFHTSRVTWSISRSVYSNEAVNCELHAEESGRDIFGTLLGGHEENLRNVFRTVTWPAPEHKRPCHGEGSVEMQVLQVWDSRFPVLLMKIRCYAVSTGTYLPTWFSKINALQTFETLTDNRCLANTTKIPEDWNFQVLNFVMTIYSVSWIYFHFRLV